MKRDRGSMVRFMPAVFTIMAVSIILIFFAGWSANVAKRDAVRQIGRTYMLSMETEGYLDASSESSLKTDLTAKGLENIDLSGTTMSEVGYGNVICLCIKGDLRINSYTLESIFKLNKGSTTIPFVMELESTAKN